MSSMRFATAATKAAPIPLPSWAKASLNCNKDFYLTTPMEPIPEHPHLYSHCCQNPAENVDPQLHRPMCKETDVFLNMSAT